MNKFEIRKKLLKARKLNNNKNFLIKFSNIIKILKKEKVNKKIIGGYYPYNHEVDSIKILNKLEKLGYKISLPKIKKNNQMDFSYWSTKEPLSINKYGIPEPISGQTVYPNILLVPLVAFDNHLNRIGYGGGFYDRYINKAKKKNKIVLIGLAYAFQKVKKIPVSKNDMKLDYILTEKNFI